MKEYLVRSSLHFQAGLIQQLDGKNKLRNLISIFYLSQNLSRLQSN
jgi:hypothetical protein